MAMAVANDFWFSKENVLAKQRHEQNIQISFPIELTIFMCSLFWESLFLNWIIMPGNIQIGCRVSGKYGMLQ